MYEFRIIHANTGKEILHKDLQNLENYTFTSEYGWYLQGMYS